MTPVASPRPGQSGAPPWELSRQTGPLPAVPGESPSGPDPAAADTDGDIKGLPRRVKQASLAPQLRASPPPRRTTVASVGPSGGPAGPTPAEIRQTMSALQRGWQEGRAQRMTNPDGSAAGGPGSSPGSPDGGSREPSADKEARGGSDGP